MIAEGEIILFRFPQTNLAEGKLRPALLLRKIPNGHDDWLVCMVSTKVHQQIEDLELVLKPTDPDFGATGLKQESLVRSSRLAVVDAGIFKGKLGAVSSARLGDIRKRLARWLQAGQGVPD